MGKHYLRKANKDGVGWICKELIQKGVNRYTTNNAAGGVKFDMCTTCYNGWEPGVPLGQHPRKK